MLNRIVYSSGVSTLFSNLVVLCCLGGSSVEEVMLLDSGILYLTVQQFCFDHFDKHNYNYFIQVPILINIK